MSEPESLATEEALDTHVRRHAYDRLLMLSDGIFAIAITLAALEIRLPEHGLSLAAEAKALLRPLAAYLVSFGMIAIFWIHHRDLFARLRKVDGVITLLTLALLCGVSLIPAMVNGIYGDGGGDTPFRLYGLTMIACGLINSTMWAYAALRTGVMMPEVTKPYRQARTLITLAIPIVFLPVVFAPLDQLAWFLVPLAVATGVFRRLLMPRWLKRAEGR